MKIPKPVKQQLFPQEDAKERKSAAEAFLKQMSDEAGDYIEAQPTFEEVRDRYRFSVSLVYWSTIIGSVVLLLGAVAYLTIPSPTAYITTQEGQIIDLPPIQVTQHE
ncbi:hypothetical protein [Pseudomonas sp. PLMAX]|uniref:hypothetical protein n=1 Tax=Pseudomonas sp. PLMAX TaxID=2201998 RepID=UPI0038B70299